MTTGTLVEVVDVTRLKRCNHTNCDKDKWSVVQRIQNGGIFDCLNRT